ncbi:Aminotran-1-2 domain-containing protein [Mycena indigotica]|uniref:histidinol-phosphate transaminase n=1 Tax=Mycena indigotica TaxID=2126181 RepID=A0A8H6S434_9AGAR|nr:Aminotran-1-2 domain-containing protein [Mycena indigotica]KAF7291953.1 Aminotran-1-2 domain-containing protein [Mycena indigotica]
MSIHGLAPNVANTGPSHFNILDVIRPNILALHPYRCAHEDYQTGILLDANENAFGHSIQGTVGLYSDAPFNDDLHHYPDPTQYKLKSRIAVLRGLPENAVDHIFLGVCVAPGRDKVITTPPTYGMYGVCAQINDVGVVECPLELSGANGEGGEHGRFSLQLTAIKAAIEADPAIKLILICSPGNPTSTLIPRSVIRELLDYPKFKGIVVVDEAYIDFASPDASAMSLIQEYGNICVMQTISKSFGLAGVRLGIAIAQPPLIQVLANAKAPYNISTPTSYIALSALSQPSIVAMRASLAKINVNRASLLKALSSVPGVGSAIGGSDANFILVPILDQEGQRPDNERAQRMYRLLAEENGVVVRFRGNEPGCLGCVRITVGTEEENAVVVAKMRKVLSEI